MNPPMTTAAMSKTNRNLPTSAAVEPDFDEKELADGMAGGRT
jgi:hypothetical protein